MEANRNENGSSVIQKNRWAGGENDVKGAAECSFF